MSKVNPIEELSKFYATNGKTKQVENVDQVARYEQLMNDGQIDDVPPVIRIALGLRNTQKAKQDEQTEKNDNSDQ